jgi:hypothetical protein
MTPDDYKRTKALAKAVASFYRPGFPVDGTNPDYNDYAGKAIKTLREQVHDERERWRYGMVTQGTPSKLIHHGNLRFHAPTLQKIKQYINHRFGTGRTDVEVKLGKVVSAEKIAKEARSRWAKGPIIEFTLGHMWERKVYNEFYKNGNLDSEWFVLSATEVRVNKKHQFRLFEAMLFRPDFNEMREGYVVKATIGKEKADIAFTAPLAIEKGLAILDQAVRERVIQKEDNHE